MLNPYSGEWIKAMKIVMAEMGLIDYAGKITRGKSAFEGVGAKDKREKYIIIRLAFLRAFFRINGISEVPLYRGVSSEIDFFKTTNSILSCTFNSSTAKEFACIDNSENFRSCYWIKFICPVEKIFMTYLETKEFNERYQEQECVVFYQNQAWF